MEKKKKFYVTVVDDTVTYHQSVRPLIELKQIKGFIEIEQREYRALRDGFYVDLRERRIKCTITRSKAYWAQKPPAEFSAKNDRKGRCVEWSDKEGNHREFKDTLDSALIAWEDLRRQGHYNAIINHI